MFVSTGATVYYELEEYEKAIADCERATSIDPNFTKAYFRCGQSHHALYSKSDSADKAIEQLQKALDLDGENSEVKSLLEYA